MRALLIPTPIQLTMKKLILSLLVMAWLIPGQSQQLISSTFKGSRTKAQMQTLFGAFMQNGIQMYKITYTTPDVFGQLDTASGLLVLPVRDGSFAYPLLCYMHGTVNSKTDVPSNLQGGWDLAAVTGGMGYVSAAPDFLGLGEARGFHPYVHADSEASAGVDMLYAVRQYAEENGIVLNDQVFVTGYSQGGHAAAAVHRALEQEYSDDFTVTASAPMSGPYSISGEMKKLILSDQSYGTVAYLPYTALSYDMVYDIYGSTNQFFKEPYASYANDFYNGEISLASLNIQCITRLFLDHGASITKYMLQDSIIDALTNNPQHPAVLALIDNDLTNWAPQAPTRLFYCEGDDQVPYTNAIVADSIMNSLGAPDLQAISVDMDADHGDCVEPAVFQTLLFFAQYQQITVGANATPSAKSIKVFPNPVSDGGYLHIQQAPVNTHVQLTDLSGRVLSSSVLSDTDNRLPVHGLKNGMYLLQMQWDGGAQTEKIVINAQ